MKQKRILYPVSPARLAAESPGRATCPVEAKTGWVRLASLSSLLFALYLLDTGHWTPDTAFGAAALVVDDFEGEEIQNKLSARSNVYVKAPSRVMMSRQQADIKGKKTQVLMLRYDKKAEGGPSDMGGWCGYYTLLKTAGHMVAPTADNPNPPPATEEYLDGTSFKAITFWVRAETGDENFLVGLSDRHWDQIGDSVKSEEIGKYLPAGKLTTEWQKATVPLDTFFVDYVKLAAISFCFEGDLYPALQGAGTIYIDDITLE